MRYHPAVPGNAADAAGLRTRQSMSTPAARTGFPATEWLLFGLLGLCWGSSYLFIKIGVETLPTFTLIAGRLGIGSLLIATVLLLAREPLPRDLRTYGHLCVLAAINIIVPFTLITWGERAVDSSMAAVLNSTVPLFTIVMAALAFHEEAITVGRLLGLVAGFGGVVILTSRTLLGGSGGDALAELALVASSASYGLGNVYARRMVRGLRPMVPAFFQVFIAFLATATLALATERPLSLSWRADAVFAVAWLGIMGSGFAYLIYYRLMRAWGPTRTSMVAYILPVVGLVLGFVVLAETIDARILLGTAFIVAGIGLVNSRFGRRQLYRRGGREAPRPGGSPLPGTAGTADARGAAARPGSPERD